MERPWPCNCGSLMWVLVLVIGDEGICYSSYILAQGPRYGRRSHDFFLRAQGIGLGAMLRMKRI
jgi:hypothetical protein